jgi:hypothetical protein
VYFQSIPALHPSSITTYQYSFRFFICSSDLGVTLWPISARLSYVQARLKWSPVLHDRAPGILPRKRESFDISSNVVCNSDRDTWWPQHICYKEEKATNVEGRNMVKRGCIPLSECKGAEMTCTGASPNTVCRQCGFQAEYFGVFHMCDLPG